MQEQATFLHKYWLGQDAGHDIPILKQAKAEYAKLQSSPANVCRLAPKNEKNKKVSQGGRGRPRDPSLSMSDNSGHSALRSINRFNRWGVWIGAMLLLRVLRIRGSVLDFCQLRQPSDAKPGRHQPGDSLCHV
jgi:hypothetical protein